MAVTADGSSVSISLWLGAYTKCRPLPLLPRSGLFGRYRPDDETSAKTVAAAALIVDERARHRCHFDADRWPQE